ncbi:50S ribosomal protein L3 [Candidatus Saccharibacteria bacterium]|nr:50S ribosomal protein L3 [Candidatus Saccharibacteria bacterium]
MTQLFDENGRLNSVTLLQAGPCVVTQLKDDVSDGYTAVQLGFGKAKKLAKPQAGHLKKAKAESRYIAEFRLPFSQAEAGVDQADNPTVGDTITAGIFSIGDKVEVASTSKGKGFAGTIKRHNFSRGPKTHGSHNYRAPGSIGAGYPQHVFKGQKMAGQMGNAKVTVKNLQIVFVDVEKNIIGIKGAVPGPKKGLVRVQGRQE